MSFERIPEVFSTPQEACAAVGAVYEDCLIAGKFAYLADAAKGRRNRDCRGYLFPDLTGGLIFNYRLGVCAMWSVANVRKMSAIERFRLFERARLSEAQADEERRKEEERAATVAEAVMREATPATECGHAYLKRKHVIPVAPLGVLDADRINEIDRSLRPDNPFRLWNPKRREPMRGPVLCVPYFLKGSKRLVSVEYISEDGAKCALRDGRMSGAYWAPDGLNDEVRTCGRVAVAEGLATALSVSQVTGVPCVSARSCSGLMSTAKNLKRRFPKADLFVCSDIGNGEAQAKAAALETGARLAKPPFTKDLIERFQSLTGSTDGPTDFNDFYLARGDI